MKTAMLANTALLGVMALAQAPAQAMKSNRSELDPASFSFVLHFGAPYVVLSSLAEESWGEGASSRLPSDYPVTVRQHAKASALPAALRAWRGREVALFDEKASVCRGRVTELFVLHRIDASMLSEKERAASPEAILRATPEHAIQRLLAGRVEARSGACGGALWARDVRLPEPVLYAPGAKVTKAMRHRVQSRMRKLNAYKGLQRTFVAEVRPQGSARWDEYQEAVLDVTSFRAPNGRTFLVSSVDAGEGCGSFHAALWSVWEVVPRRGASELLLRSADEPSDSGFRPVTLVDADGSGNPMAVASTVLYRKAGKAYTQALSLPLPFFGCGC
jgi:hypothetical protein